jgi:hypothetical protein
MSTSHQNYTVENYGETINFKVSFIKRWIDIVSVAVEILAVFAVVLYSIFIAPVPASFVPFLILFFVLFLVELLWILYGVEILEVSNSRIVIKHRIFGFGVSKRLLSKKIGGVFVTRSKIDDQFLWQLTKGFMPADFKKGMITIYYGKSLLGRIKTFRFGTTLNETEAQQIVKLIHEKFPQYIYSSGKKTDTSTRRY